MIFILKKIQTLLFKYTCNNDQDKDRLLSIYKCYVDFEYFVYIEYLY